jgi:hypothetical protein
VWYFRASLMEEHRVAKRVAPILSRIVPMRLSRAGGLYLDILQGRGSGTGWDLVGETAAAADSLALVKAPVIFDGGANVGKWSCALHAQLRDSTARFVLFEPQLACRSKLDGLALPGKTIIPAALSSAPVAPPCRVLSQVTDLLPSTSVATRTSEICRRIVS